MSTRDGEQRGLQELLADVLTAEEADPALLVRYARAPHGLSAAEREQVERLRESSRAVADQLAILRHFELPGQERAGAEASDAGRELWARVARRLGQILGGLRYLVLQPAFAYALVALLLYPAYEGLRGGELLLPEPGVPGGTAGGGKPKGLGLTPWRELRLEPGAEAEVGRDEVGTEGLALRLFMPPIDGGAGSAVEVRVRSEDGRRELREAAALGPDGTLELKLPRAWLSAGRYRVEAAAARPLADTPEVVTYGLAVR